MSDGVASLASVALDVPHERIVATMPMESGRSRRELNPRGRFGGGPLRRNTVVAMTRIRFRDMATPDFWDGGSVTGAPIASKRFLAQLQFLKSTYNGLAHQRRTAGLMFQTEQVEFRV